MKNIETLLTELTLEEKAALLEGTHSWNTNAVQRLGVPALFLTDGPHGLRKVRQSGGGFDIANNEHSTAFPTSATTASSWNPENARRMGEAIAEECLAAGVHVLLAPGINIKRSPLCGRNFEYYAEDPLLSGSFGAAFVNGVQSRGVGCSLKHFAANSNEDYRFVGDSRVDERALREIYLRAFEKIVKEAKPFTVMCSYNRLNGVFSSQNTHLLTEILRDEWNFDGLVMTDWGATCDRVKGVLAGCDLDMPGDVPHNRCAIVKAVRAGTLPEETLNRSVKRVLQLVAKCGEQQRTQGYDAEAHAQLACEIAKDSGVLLKNDGVLPLSGQEKLLVVGELFEKMRYQGAGSSLLNPSSVITPKNAFDKRHIAYTYRKGYCCLHEERSEDLEQAAVEAAAQADTILFFGGLTDFEESEGFDRDRLELGSSQTALLNRLLATGKKVVLVLYAGAPVSLPFWDGLSAMLDLYLPGLYGGEATAALLYGESNPSGKLTESWPLRLEDTSCFADYDRGSVSQYYESIYVGYRFYDKAKTKLRFPFGYGLSYTSFAYQNLQVRQDSKTVAVTAEITNTGSRAGAEAVQLYVKNNGGAVFKAEKELRAFTKVQLQPGETKTYEICLAASAADIRLRTPLCVTDGEESPSPYSTAVQAAYTQPPRTVPDAFPELLGSTVPVADDSEPLTMESTLRAFRKNWIGRIFYFFVMQTVRKSLKAAQKMPDSLERETRLKNAYFVVRMMPANSLRSMAMSSGGQFPYQVAQGFVQMANGHFLRGLRIMLQKETLPNKKEHTK